MTTADRDRQTDSAAPGYGDQGPAGGGRDRAKDEPAAEPQDNDVPEPGSRD